MNKKVLLKWKSYSCVEVENLAVDFRVENESCLKLLQSSPLSPRKNMSYSNSPRFGGHSGPSNDIWRKIQDIEDEIKNLEQNNQVHKRHVM